MEELQRIDIKIPVEKGTDIPATAFMGIFQGWIREHAIEGVLIDAADYSHMHHGPGIVLVGHEMTVSMDYADGEMGLLYRQRQPLDGCFEERCAAVLKKALIACEVLEGAPELEGRLTFRKDAFRFISNDRLNGPKKDEVLGALRTHVATAAKTVYAKDASADPIEGDSRERAALSVTLR